MLCRRTHASDKAALAADGRIAWMVASGAGGERCGHKHNGWTHPELIVIDASTLVFDHPEKRCSGSCVPPPPISAADIALR